MINQIREEYTDRLIDLWNSQLTDKKIMGCLKKIMRFNTELYWHSIRVAMLNTAFGIELGKGDLELSQLIISALLHDFGKLYVPLEILQKKGALTVDEWKTMEMHPVRGYFFLKRQTDLNEKILLPILEHHERVDGSGYGLGLQGSEITEHARMISITDVYEAMTTDRVYRHSIPECCVIEYLVNKKGTQFDCELTDIFINLISNLRLDYLM